MQTDLHPWHIVSNMVLVLVHYIIESVITLVVQSIHLVRHSLRRFSHNHTTFASFVAGSQLLCPALQTALNLGVCRMTRQNCTLARCATALFDLHLKEVSKTSVKSYILTHMIQSNDFEQVDTT